MYHASLLAIATLLLASMSASANLNKREEGRIAVAQCYAQCAKQLTDSELTINNAEDEIKREDPVYLSMGGYSRPLGDLVGDDRVPESTYIEWLCDQGDLLIEAAQVCQAGCQDAEIVYGVRSARARIAFNKMLSERRTAHSANARLCAVFSAAR